MTERFEDGSEPGEIREEVGRTIRSPSPEKKKSIPV
jgi:hypothetical protein